MCDKCETCKELREYAEFQARYNFWQAEEARRALLEHKMAVHVPPVVETKQEANNG